MFIILLLLIFIRPFISSLAFPEINFIYTTIFLVTCIYQIIPNKLNSDKIKLIHYALLSFLAGLFLSCLFSINKPKSLEELPNYISGISVFLFALSLSQEHKERLIQIILIAGFLISVLAIYQYFFGFQQVLNYLNLQPSPDLFALDYISRKRVFFPFPTPNILGGYLIMILPLSLAVKKKIWFALPILGALILTKSMGALLSLLLAYTLYFYIRGTFTSKAIFPLFSLLLLTGVIFILRSQAQGQHARPVFSTLMRLNYWRDTLLIIQNHPLTGIGLGNFDLTQSRYAHNSYLQIWAETGIIGLISWLWIIFKTLRARFKKIIFSKGQSNLPACLFCAGAAFLFHNTVDFTFFIPEVSLIWWVIIGL